MPIHPLALALLALCVTSPASAQSWRGEGNIAGFATAGRFAGLLFECLPGGRLRTVVAGNGASFPADRDMTLVLSIDGTARVTSVRAEPDPAGGSRFARVEPSGEAADLLAALRRGRAVEVSTPAGTMTLPLSGSERALGGLAGRCGT